MGFANRISFFGWLQDGQVHVSVVCRDHMAKGVQETRLTPHGKTIAIVCAKMGCELGEWTNAEELAADYQDLEARWRGAHWELPATKA